MIFFSDPLPVDRPAERAVRMALALQEAFTPISEAWAKLGHDVGLGIGIAQGEATLGVIGFEQRWEYAAIGNVPNLAARLCGAARARITSVAATVFTSHLATPSRRWWYTRERVAPEKLPARNFAASPRRPARPPPQELRPLEAIP